MASCNFVAMILCIFAAIGMSTNAGQLKKFYWVKGEVALPISGDKKVNIEMYMGVNMRVSRLDCNAAADPGLCKSVFLGTGAIKLNNTWKEVETGIFEQEMKWSDPKACGQSSGAFTSAADAAKGQEMCEECKGAAISNPSLILGILGQWPTLLTNLQRSTQFGDVNCQSVMGVLSNIWGTIMTMTSIMAYNTACYKKFPTKVETLNGDATISWTHGFGFICLIVATLIKVPDCIGHFIIPTPPARHKPPETKPESAAEYMMLSHSPKQIEMGEPVGKGNG